MITEEVGHVYRFHDFGNDRNAALAADLRAALAAAASPQEGGNGSRDALQVDREALAAALTQELARHVRGRLRTDRDGFHRADRSCRWAGSPWQRDDRFRDEHYDLITAREAVDAEWRQHLAAALAPLLGSPGETP